MATASNIDYLTGFPLRDRLYSSLEELVNRSGLEKKHFSVVLIDVDRFKEFNDKLGHLFGDKILEYIAYTLSSHFSTIECRFFRYGGDEIVIAMLGQDARQSFRLMKDCALDLYRRPYMFKNKLHKITLSCGIACFPDDGVFVEELLQKADKAMYFSKKRGRNAVTLAADMPRLRVLRSLSLLLRIGGVVGVFLLLLRFAPMRATMQVVFDKLKDAGLLTEFKGAMTLQLNEDKILKGRVVKETAKEIVFEVTVDKSQIGK